MIVAALLEALLNIFGGLEAYIIPILPAAFRSLWPTVLGYFGEGINFLKVTLHFDYLRSLFVWWLNVRTLVFVGEAIYHIWVLVTGNDNAHAPVSD